MREQKLPPELANTEKNSRYCNLMVLQKGM